jgi:ribulose-5-phosphate 4-epimerase/fuculose-1-phosphate aldolase
MAALLRLTAREGLHEGISNHFRYALSENGQRFLMNPYGVHLHSQFATALVCLKNPDLPPIDQTSARFFNRLSWDVGFDGMGIGSEGERLAACLGNHNVLMMGAHGFLVAAQTPALAWDIAYHLERAAKNYITALSAGREVNILPGHIAEKTAQ